MVALLGFSFSVNAQENGNRDENGKVVRGAYETNPGSANWFIGLGAGVNSVYNNKDFGKFGLATDVNFGKWFTPSVGARLGWRGWSNEAKNGGAYYDGQFDNFHLIHADLLWNLSNALSGYKETRFWDIIPYATFGDLYTRAKDVPGMHGWEFAAGLGILNDFRLGKHVDLFVDISAVQSREAAFYKEAEDRYITFPSVTAGLIFNLGKSNFDRHSSITPVVVPVPFTTEQYNALKDKVAALEKENAELKDKIAALEEEVAPLRQLTDGQTYLYENGKFTAVDVKPGSPITLYFDCGSAKLSEREKAHFEYFANTVVDENSKLAVNGYADKQTGSAKRNQQLSEQRVKTVVDLLLKAGAKEENIESAAHGATVQLFDGAAKNRVVTVELQ